MRVSQTLIAASSPQACDAVPSAKADAADGLLLQERGRGLGRLDVLTFTNLSSPPDAAAWASGDQHAGAHPVRVARDRAAAAMASASGGPRARGRRGSEAPSVQTNWRRGRAPDLDALVVRPVSNRVPSDENATARTAPEWPEDAALAARPRLPEPHRPVRAARRQLAPVPPERRAVDRAVVALEAVRARRPLAAASPRRACRRTRASRPRRRPSTRAGAASARTPTPCTAPRWPAASARAAAPPARPSARI